MIILNDLILIKPSKENEKEILAYKQEYVDFGEGHIHGSSGLAGYADIGEWLEMVHAIEKDALSSLGVHASTFFSVRRGDPKIIGSIQLRHSLTPDLEKYGGHIGYGIRPSERQKGYGKQQLLCILDVARDMKLPRVMITCDEDNTASRRTAIACGGVLAHKIYNEREGKMQLAYWIDLNANPTPQCP